MLAAINPMFGSNGYDPTLMMPMDHYNFIELKKRNPALQTVLDVDQVPYEQNIICSFIHCI